MVRIGAVLENRGYINVYVFKVKGWFSPKCALHLSFAAPIHFRAVGQSI